MEFLKKGQTYTVHTSKLPDVEVTFDKYGSSAEFKFEGSSEIIHVKRKGFWKISYEVKRGLGVVGEAKTKRWYKSEMFIKLNFVEYKIKLKSIPHLKIEVSKTDETMFNFSMQVDKSGKMICDFDMSETISISDDVLYLASVSLFLFLPYLAEDYNDFTFVA